jgi:hypothetical protein
MFQPSYRSLTGFLLVLFIGSLAVFPVWAGGKKKMKTTLHLESRSFPKGGRIPDKYTCKGENVSPELNWKGAPPKTQSFALIVDDPDAPTQTWVHWVVYNIPIQVRQESGSVYELLEGFPRDEKLTNGIVQGSNDFKNIGYDGPCPPSGAHRYYFHLYALDTVLNLAAGATKPLLLSRMKGHVLAETQLVGIYEKK